MIERRHEVNGTESSALYSNCESYRYALSRRWAPGAGLLWVMLNPSTATEVANDATIERCERRTRAGGWPAMTIANLFAFRTTRPVDLRRASDPVGPENASMLARLGAEAGTVVCAWGAHGAYLGQDRVAIGLLPDRLMALGVTRDGHPRHPLYVPYSVSPSSFSPTPISIGTSSATSPASSKMKTSGRVSA